MKYYSPAQVRALLDLQAACLTQTHDLDLCVFVRLANDHSVPALVVLRLPWSEPVHTIELTGPVLDRLSQPGEVAELVAAVTAEQPA